MTDYHFFAPETVADPYPLFDRLREDDPVYATNFGYWYVSRYDDANRLLRDPALGAGRGVPDSMGITSGPLYDLMTTWMMAIDGPDHTRVRRLISPRVHAARRRGDAPAHPGRSPTGCSTSIAARGGADIVAEYAFPLPMEVVRLLFGVDADEWAANVTRAVRSGNRRSARGGPLGPMGALAEWFVGRRRRRAARTRAPTCSRR